MPDASVSVAVVTYNALPFIEQCLQSVAGRDTVVVDHGSTDGTLALLRERFHDVRVVAQENLGLAAGWNRFLAQPFDAERTLVVPWNDGHDYDVPCGVILAQALHHGNEHRAHLCTVLSSLGLTPPALGLWDYAEATHRAKPRPTQPSR